MRQATRSVEARLREPFISSRGALRVVPLQVVRIEDDAGHTGFGETPDPHEIHTALDVARLDLEGRRQGQPIWRLLGASAAPVVEVNATIATADPAVAARKALAAGDAGFRCVKVKVGGGGEPELLGAVRAAAGPDVSIRIDANGAWSPERAITVLRELEPLGIECCEQPCSELEAIARVAEAVAVPIALDESTADPAAFAGRVCAAVCLKIARCGGISGVIAAARQARAVGYEVYLASMLDGALGIAAALHAAAIVKPDRPSGLATLALFAGRDDPMPPRNGRMMPPEGAGLGAGLFDWYAQGKPA